MSQIVRPLQSNLLLQMLLQLNLYILYTWAVGYLLQMYIQTHHIELTVMLIYLPAVIIERLRLYVGYRLNLCVHKLNPKNWILSTLAYCLTLLLALWYLHVALLSHRCWLQILWNAWLLCMALEAILAVYRHRSKNE